MEKYVESKVRTEKLYCSECENKIRKGEWVVFKLYNGKMEDVYCSFCKHDYIQDIIEGSEHPFSSEALGQD